MFGQAMHLANWSEQEKVSLHTIGNTIVPGGWRRGRWLQYADPARVSKSYLFGPRSRNCPAAHVRNVVVVIDVVVVVVVTVVLVVVEVMVTVVVVSVVVITLRHVVCPSISDRPLPCLHLRIGFARHAEK